MNNNQAFHDKWQTVSGFITITFLGMIFILCIVGLIAIITVSFKNRIKIKSVKKNQKGANKLINSLPYSSNGELIHLFYSAKGRSDVYVNNELNYICAELKKRGLMDDYTYQKTINPTDS